MKCFHIHISQCNLKHFGAYKILLLWTTQHCIVSAIQCFNQFSLYFMEVRCVNLEIMITESIVCSLFRRECLRALLALVHWTDTQKNKTYAEGHANKPVSYFIKPLQQPSRSYCMNCIPVFLAQISRIHHASAALQVWFCILHVS